MRSSLRSLRIFVAASIPVGLALAFAACSGTSDAVVTSSSGEDAGGTTIDEDGGTIGTDAGKKDASSTYPAKHPSAPEVQSYGGSVLTNPHLQPIVFEGDPKQGEIKDFTHKLAGSTYWSGAVAEYGVGDVTVSDPIVIPASETTAPASITDDQIQTFLQAHLDGAHTGWGTPDPSTIYTIYYPASTTITLDDFGASCDGFGGYHGSTTVGSVEVPYAVMPRCSELGPLQGEDDVMTGASTHEFIEAATDPFASNPAYATADEQHFYYDLMPLSEIGDMCTFESDSFVKPTEIGYAVQRVWSNKLAKAGGSPCAPLDPTSTYFAAVPVPTENVQMDFGSQGKANVKGIKLAVGQSKTIDLDFVASGPTDDFIVQAMDVPGYEGQSSELSFSIDQETGNNGDIGKLTITRTATGSQYGGTEYIVTAYQDPTHYHLWMGWVSN